MKYYINLLIYCVFYGAATILQAQTVPWNLVKNYSFENYSGCVYNNDAIDTSMTNQRILPDWFSASVMGSPDYFNRCYQIPLGGPYTFSVPSNIKAFQNTANITENAYTGIALTLNIGVVDTEFREYLQTKLKQKLIIGKKYCVGSKVNFAYDINANNILNDVFKTSDLAILVSKTRPFNDKIAAPDRLIIEANPQITTNQYIDDTLNWTLLKGIVVGSGEEWLTIGNFKPEWQSNMALVHDAAVMNSPLSYYFIDDVFVIPMENDQALVHKDTSVCANGFPVQLTANTGFTGYMWNNGTQNQTLTVNAAGTYTVSATYAGCTIVDTIRVKTASIPDLELPNYSICENKLPFTVTLPSAVTDVFDTFEWSNGNVGNSGILQTANTYTVTATMECGSTSTNFVITTAPEPPSFSLGNDTSYCINGRPSPLILKPNVLLPNYQWSISEVQASLVVTQPGIYTLSTSNACGTKTDEIKIDGCPPNYYIPNTFTPNGDGHNDVFEIFTTDAIVAIKSLQIFDRWGEPVAEISLQKGSEPNSWLGWDGTFRNKEAASDVYVYRITLQFADGTTETVTGDVTLLR